MRKQRGIAGWACVLAAGLVGVSYGQMHGKMMGPPAARGGHSGGGPGGGGPGEAMIGNVLNDPEATRLLGLSEETASALKNQLYEIRLKQIDLEAAREKAALKQARLMTENPIDEAAVMAAVEETGKLQTELAKLQMKQLLVVKGMLSPEQLERAKDLLRERTRERMRERVEEGVGDRIREWRERRRDEPRERREPGHGRGGGAPSDRPAAEPGEAARSDETI